jgi:cysteine-rich repeat protein
VCPMVKKPFLTLILLSLLLFVIGCSSDAPDIPPDVPQELVDIVGSGSGEAVAGQAVSGSGVWDRYYQLRMWTHQRVGNYVQVGTPTRGWVTMGWPVSMGTSATDDDLTITPSVVQNGGGINLDGSCANDYEMSWTAGSQGRAAITLTRSDGRVWSVNLANNGIHEVPQGHKLTWSQHARYGEWGWASFTLECNEQPPEPICGNGLEETREQCDDGNTLDGDGCSSQCYIESGSSFCGNGIRAGSEQCDDGNTANLDGCTSICQVQPGWTCSGDRPSTCTRLCGNGILDSGEQCDDGSNNAFSCSAAYGSTCNFCDVFCRTVIQQGLSCGDGQIDGPETCDDGNTVAGDGCSSTCRAEPCAQCVQPPSGMVAWYPGDGNAQNYIQAEEGSPYGGVTYERARVTSGFKLPYRPVALNKFRVGNSMTVSAWVKLDTIGRFYQPILSQWDESIGHRAYSLTVTPSGTVRFDTSSDGNWQPGNKAETTTTLSTGTFYHITATHGLDSSTGNVMNYVYIDGVRSAEASATTNLYDRPDTTNLDIFMGQSDRFAGELQFFNGIIDELQVYNVALGPSEVQGIVQAANCGVCKPTPPSIPRLTFTTEHIDSSGLFEGRSYQFLLRNIENGPVVSCSLMNRPDNLGVFPNVVIGGFHPVQYDHGDLVESSNDLWLFRGNSQREPVELDCEQLVEWGVINVDELDQYGENRRVFSVICATSDFKVHKNDLRVECTSSDLPDNFDPYAGNPTGKSNGEGCERNRECISGLCGLQDAQESSGTLGYIYDYVHVCTAQRSEPARSFCSVGRECRSDYCYGYDGSFGFCSD